MRLLLPPVMLLLSSDISAADYREICEAAKVCDGADCAPSDAAFQFLSLRDDESGEYTTFFVEADGTRIEALMSEGSASAAAWENDETAFAMNYIYHAGLANPQFALIKSPIWGDVSETRLFIGGCKLE
jgi:hypothetical protein